MKSIMNVGVDHVTTYSSANKVQSRSRVVWNPAPSLSGIGGVSRKGRGGFLPSDI